MRPEPFLVGLDLGQSADPTALAVLEKEPVLDDAGEPTRDGRNHPLAAYNVVHLERYPLGLSYPDMVERVAELLRRPAMQARGRPQLAIDATGVGRAVVDMFKEAYRRGEFGNYRPRPVTITAGEQPRGLHVPKRDLVATVQSLLQTGSLKIAETLELADVLTSELLAFRAKISRTGHDTYEAWRESDHDDLVLALALACWYKNPFAPPRYVTREGDVVEYAWLGK